MIFEECTTIIIITDDVDGMLHLATYFCICDYKCVFTVLAIFRNISSLPPPLTLLSANVDYKEPAVFQLTFTSGSTCACVNITIIDDPVIEEDETFIVAIPPGQDVFPIRGGNTTTITVIDNDGEPSV